MTGWLRIGLILPSTNATCEPDFYRVVPKGVTVHTHRMWHGASKPGDYDAQLVMNDDVETAARYLATADVDVLVYACTGGSFLKGPGYDQEIVSRIEGMADRPAVATAGACREALEFIGAHKVSVATPYPAGENGRLRVFYEAAGFEVLNVEGDPRTATGPVLGIARQDPEEILEFASRICRPDADVLFCACTAWRALDVVERLEESTGKPVVTANQASLWAALRKIGVEDPIYGYGTLLKASKVASR